MEAKTKKIWKEMVKVERISMLVHDFGMSRKEAEEIYTEDPSELPDEIAEDIEEQFLTYPLNDV